MGLDLRYLMSLLKYFERHLKSRDLYSDQWVESKVRNIYDQQLFNKVIKRGSIFSNQILITSKCSSGMNYLQIGTSKADSHIPQSQSSNARAASCLRYLETPWATRRCSMALRDNDGDDGNDDTDDDGDARKGGNPTIAGRHRRRLQH